MNPNDPIMIQRQQHEENLRRMQQQEQQRRLEQAENQRRLDHQQLIEDEEREEPLRQERARAMAADGSADEAPAKKGRRWPFGGKRRDPASRDGELPDDGLTDEPRDEPLEPSHTSTSGMSTMFWLVALVLAGMLAWFFVPRMFKSADKAAPAVAQPRDPSLPVAAPGDPLTVTAGPGLPEAAGPAVSITDPLAVPPAAEAAQNAEAPRKAASAPQAAPTDTASELAAALAMPAGTENSPAAPAPAPAPEAVVLRVAALEMQLASLQQELQRLQEHSAPAAASTSPAVAAQSAAAAPRPAPKRRRTVARATVRQAAPAVASAQASAPSAEQQLRNQMQAQLLAIDVWDGRPSVVVGTGLPGDKRVRVLQPGEQLHGVGLHSVDVAAGKATFSVGAGSLVTLDVKEAMQP